ncbi:MAG TPA: hypothetical protein VK775_08170, partial [Chthoniobacterales bacterium]|nr:hypothetical protein [Chthoniobacterales bacterium]
MRGSRENEKHRTEVTEVAEGGIGLVGGCLAGTPRLECEGHAKTESIAQRSRRSQRGNWIGRRTSGGNTAAWVRGSRENGKHRTEVMEVAEGGIGLVGGCLAGT